MKACQAILGKNKRKLEKYHSSLGAGKSNGLFHDAAKKVKWMFFVKSDVPELRARLAHFVGILNTQISLEDRYGVEMNPLTIHLNLSQTCECNAIKEDTE